MVQHADSSDGTSEMDVVNGIFLCHGGTPLGIVSMPFYGWFYGCGIQGFLIEICEEEVLLTVLVIGVFSRDWSFHSCGACMGIFSRGHTRVFVWSSGEVVQLWQLL